MSATFGGLLGAAVGFPLSRFGGVITGRAMVVGAVAGCSSSSPARNSGGGRNEPPGTNTTRDLPGDRSRALSTPATPFSPTGRHPGTSLQSRHPAARPAPSRSGAARPRRSARPFALFSCARREPFPGVPSVVQGRRSCPAEPAGAHATTMTAADRLLGLDGADDGLENLGVLLAHALGSLQKVVVVSPPGLAAVILFRAVLGSEEELSANAAQYLAANASGYEV